MLQKTHRAWLSIRINKYFLISNLLLHLNIKSQPHLLKFMVKDKFINILMYQLKIPINNKLMFLYILISSRG